VDCGLAVSILGPTIMDDNKLIYTNVFIIIIII